MSDAVHESQREHIAALEKEITALRLGRLNGAPEGVSEVGTQDTRLDVSKLLDAYFKEKREKYALVQHLDEAKRALVMADALLWQKYPGGLFDMGTKKNKELDQLIGGMCFSLLRNTVEAENFASFAFTSDDADAGRNKCIVTVRYDREGTAPEECAAELRREVQRLRDQLTREGSPRLPEGITAEFPVWPRSLTPGGIELFLADNMGMETLAQIKESHRQNPTACTLLALTLSEYVEATARQGEDSPDANAALARLGRYSAALLEQRIARQQQQQRAGLPADGEGEGEQSALFPAPTP